MANVPTIIVFGNSNAEGLATLNDVPAADMTRWTGAVFPSTNPILVTVPGVRLHHAKLPFSVPDNRNIVPAGTDATHIEVDGAATLASDVDSWLYVKTAAVGQGQTRRITARAGQIYTVTTSPAVSTSGVVSRLTDSHTLTGATSTTLTKSGTTPAFTGMENKWVVVISGTGAQQITKITVVNSATQVTVSPALATVPVAGDGICVLTGTGVVDTLANYLTANTSLQDLQFALDTRQVYETGNDHPNINGFPWWSPYLDNVAQAINCVPELTWRMRQVFEEDIHCLPLGVLTSSMSPKYVGTTLGSSTFAWLHDITHDDWHPSSPTGLYSALTAAITAMAADIAAEGNTMDVVGFFPVLGEVDAAETARAAMAGANMRLIRDSLRAFIGTNGWSQQNADEIPWIMAGVGSSSWSEKDTVNAALQEIGNEDTASAYVDTTGADFTYEVDGIHYDAPGQIALGAAFADAWQAVVDRKYSATRLKAELPTLQSITTAVRNRYERTGASADARTALMTQFINDALREVYLTLGDNAPFLRLAEPLVSSATYPNTLTLPYRIKRLLRIENQSYPGQQVTWKGDAMVDSGRVRIVLHDYTGGPFIAHFIVVPPDLVEQADACLVPNDYIELVVLLTCRRLAEASGNAEVASAYAMESDRLWRWVKKDVLRHQRMRQETLTLGGYEANTNSGCDRPSSWYL